MGAIYSMAAAGWTPVNHADGATALANNSYQAHRTWAATAMVRNIEFYVGGEATSSTPQRMAVRRASTNVATPTNVAPGPYAPGPASAFQGYVTATTGPTVASTTHLVHLAFNAFGGVVRWVAAPGEEIYQITNTAANSDLILDSIAGTGAVSTHAIIEEITI